MKPKASTKPPKTVKASTTFVVPPEIAELSAALVGKQLTRVAQDGNVLTLELGAESVAYEADSLELLNAERVPATITKVLYLPPTSDEKRYRFALQFEGRAHITIAWTGSMTPATPTPAEPVSSAAAPRRKRAKS